MSEQYTYSYDVKNNLTSLVWQTWEGNGWVNSRQVTYTYDANNFTQSISMKAWNSTGTEITEGDSIYYYFHTVLGIDDLIVQEGNITVYPNPFESKTIIEFLNPEHTNYKLTIFSISGNKLFEMDNIESDKIEFERGNLPNGVYLIELEGEKVYRGKMVVK